MRGLTEAPGVPGRARRRVNRLVLPSERNRTHKTAAWQTGKCSRYGERGHGHLHNCRQAKGLKECASTQREAHGQTGSRDRTDRTGRAQQRTATGRGGPQTRQSQAKLEHARRTSQAMSESLQQRSGIGVEARAGMGWSGSGWGKGGYEGRGHCLPHASPASSREQKPRQRCAILSLSRRRGDEDDVAAPLLAPLISGTFRILPRPPPGARGY